MKIRLSMPSTTSMTTRVANANQAAGSESRTTMSCMAGSIMWPRPASIQPFLSAVEPLSPLPMPSPAAPARPTPNLAIVFLSVAAFASAANMRVIDPLLVQLAATFHVTVGEASIAATVFLFANGVFVLVHGPFGDRYGMMPVVALACIAAALCCAFGALAGSLAWLPLARFLTGVTSPAVIPPPIAWAGVALFAVMRARPDIARPEKRAGRSMIGQMLAVLRRRWALTVILVVALEGGMFWGAFTFVSTDLHQRFGLGFAAIGLAVAAFGGGGFLYVMVAPHLVRLLGERGLCIWGGSGLGIAFALMALAPTAEVEFAAIVLSGISFYMFHNTLQTNGTQMAPEARGAGMALFALCLFIGQAIGVPIAAPIVDRWGAPPVFWAAAVVLPALAFWFAAALRRRHFDRTF